MFFDDMDPTRRFLCGSAIAAGAELSPLVLVPTVAAVGAVAVTVGAPIAAVASVGAAAVGLTKGAIVLFGSTVAAAGLHDMKG